MTSQKTSTRRTSPANHTRAPTTLCLRAIQRKEFYCKTTPWILAAPALLPTTAELDLKVRRRHFIPYARTPVSSPTSHLSLCRVLATTMTASNLSTAKESLESTSQIPTTLNTCSRARTTMDQGLSPLKLSEMLLQTIPPKKAEKPASPQHEHNSAAPTRNLPITSKSFGSDLSSPPSASKTSPPRHTTAVIPHASNATSTTKTKDTFPPHTQRHVGKSVIPVDGPSPPSSWKVPLIIPGLTNSVHPILRPNQWASPNMEWNYPYLQTTLCLVSRILGMDALIKHLVVMVDGELRRDTEPWGASIETDFAELASKDVQPKIGRYPKAEHEVVDDTMRARAAEILMEVKDFMLFKLHQFPPTFGGCCYSPRNGEEGFYDPAKFDRASIIALNSKFLDDIKGCYERRRQDGREPAVEWELRIHEISLASIILHEMFHAIDNVYNRSRKSGRVCETFCGDCPLAECGFAVVAAVFGGILHVDKKKPSPLDVEIGWDGYSMSLSAWPSPALQKVYQGGSHGMGSRELKEPLKFGLSGISMEFVDRILTDDYWNVEVPKIGQSSLHVPFTWAFGEASLKNVRHEAQACAGASLNESPKESALDAVGKSGEKTDNDSDLAVQE